MQFLAGLANALDQSRLDVHVDVLEGNRPGEVALIDVREDAFQAIDNPPAFRVTYDASMRQHARMGNRAGDVVPVEPVVEADRGGECLDEGIGRFGEATAPGFFR
jgi:hypothetical protein